MAGFFDFIKKTDTGSTANTVPSVPTVMNNDNTAPVRPQSYNGIGSPPNGQSYNGIGTPPVQKSQIPNPLPADASHQAMQAGKSQTNLNNQIPNSRNNSPASGVSVSSVVKPLNQPAEQNKQNNLDLMTHLTQRSNRVFLTAQTKAKELGNLYLDTEHLLHGLLADGEIYKLLTDMKVQPQLIEQELLKVFPPSPATKAGATVGAGPTSSVVPQISPRIKRIVDNSLVVARKLGFEFISPEHLLVSLYEEGEGAAARILAKLGLKKEDLNKKVLGKKEGLEEGQAGAKKKNTLEDYAVDLTAKASQGLLDPVVERSDVIERVIHILSRRTKNNPSLVGEAGVGKTAIVEGLAEKIVARQVPEPLLDKRILQLDLMNILAGASHRGEFEERMKDMIEAVKASQGKIILFIDEIHNIVGAGSTSDGTLDASNFLKPALARGEVQLIGATTLTEYRKYIEKDPALERRFQPVLVPEPTEEQAIKMLKAIKDKYEAFHRVKIPDDAIDASVKLSKRYVGDRFLPDKAVDLIDEAASAVRLPLISLPEEIKSSQTRITELTQEMKEAEKTADRVKARILKSKIDDLQADLHEKQEEYNMKKGQTTTAVSVEIIKDIISHWTGIPVSKITGSEMERLANLEKIMHERMVNQEVAVTSVAQAVRRGRAGLKSSGRPVGSFVFLGPTGVGKTELAKTLADVLFGQEEAMIRFDMTEYMEKHEVAKLLGAPPGYVGYEEGGKLTEAVRRKPYSVVLFDEIEKAHPDIFNILLQILDDGRLTDNKGHVISFKNAVVICTSNIGTGIIQESLIKQTDAADKRIGKDKKDEKKAEEVEKPKVDESYEKVKERVMTELQKFFKPELINRFDEVIVFEPLKFEHMTQIVVLQLKAVTKLLEEQNIGFTATDRAIEEIVQAGFDPVYGARPLRRAIQKMIENPISSLIIESKVKMGDQIVTDFDGEDFIFNIEKIELVTPSATQKKNYFCESCTNKFTTEVVKNSTVICPKCLSVKVQEAVEEKKDELHAAQSQNS